MHDDIHEFSAFTQKFAEHEWNFKNGKYRDVFFKCLTTFNLSATFLECRVMREMQSGQSHVEKQWKSSRGMQKQPLTV